jgi:hypothetical protein
MADNGCATSIEWLHSDKVNGAAKRMLKGVASDA